MNKIIISALAVFTAMTMTLTAGTTSFAYQGVIKDALGANLQAKNQTIEFRLYESPSEDIVLWGRTIAVLLDDNGLFNVELADNAGSPISGTAYTELKKALLATASSSLYIGLTVQGSSGEISPRQRVLQVPFAAFALDTANAQGDFTAEGTVRSARLESNSANIDGNLTAKTLVVSETASVAGTLSANNGITANGKVTLNGNVVVGNNYSISGNGTIPVGGIIMWSGSPSTIPAGWALCNGSNGTPDLSGRFIVGVGTCDGKTYSAGNSGGKNSVSLTVEQLPPHSHSIKMKTVGYVAAWNGSKEAAAAPNQSKNNGEQTKYTESTGSSAPHENRPPYYALCFIMRKS